MAARRRLLDISGATVSTFAGSGTWYDAELDGTLLTARFSEPWGIAIDAAGNIYVADTNGNDIRKITPDGMVTTLAGKPGVPGYADGTGSAAMFDEPAHIALDAAGNIYVADYRNDVIRKVTPSGVVTTFAGKYTGGGYGGYKDGSALEAEFNAPEGIAVDANGTVYVSDRFNNAIRKITPDGVVNTVAGSYVPGPVYGEGQEGFADGVGPAARFASPDGLAFDSAGNLLVADTDNGSVRRIAPDGMVTTVAGNGQNGYIDGAAATAEFWAPESLTVDKSGDIIVDDSGNSCIREISTNGSVSTVAGTPDVFGDVDGAGSTAQFNYPTGITFDAKGELLVCDSDNNRIRDVHLTPSAAFTVAIDGQQVFDGTGTVLKTFDDLIPTVEVDLKGGAGNYDINSVSISFSARPDGTTPTMDPSSRKYDPTTGIWQYFTPFKQQSLLFLGDQSMTVTVTGKDGTTTSKTIDFSIGESNQFAGFPSDDTMVAQTPDLASADYGDSPDPTLLASIQQSQVASLPKGKAYSVLAAAAPSVVDTIPPDVQAKVDSGEWVEFDEDAAQFCKAIVGLGDRVPPGFVIRVFGPATAALRFAGPVGVAAIVWLGTEYDDPRGFIVRDGDTIEAGDLGDYMIPTEEYARFESRYGAESPYKQLGLRSDVLVDSVIALVQQKKNRGKFELWQTLKNAKDQLIVFEKDGILFHERTIPGTNSKGNSVEEVLGAPLPGLGSGPWWPAAATPDFRIRQWADTAREVLQYSPDFVYRHHPSDSRGGLVDGESKIFGNNFIPRFPVHRQGRLDDDRIKPYIDEPRVVLKQETGGFDTIDGASYVHGRTIAARPLSWKQSVLDYHWGKHNSEVAAWANEDTYAQAAISFLRGSDSTDHFVRFDGAILMKDSTYFGVWSNGNANDGGILTFFKPDNLNRTWSRWKISNQSE